ncbi:MAG TPA: hypothetical protein VD763_10815 [Candidatus Saccharimonadales bacterium]|nr:hypothetical protein [Candidatus Saccharimonadales bacterium]
MDRTVVIAIARIGFAVLTLTAIAVQAASLVGIGRFDAGNFFSYFTILSNVLAASVFLIGAVPGRGAHTKRWELVRVLPSCT